MDFVFSKTAGFQNATLSKWEIHYIVFFYQIVRTDVVKCTSLYEHFKASFSIATKKLLLSSITTSAERVLSSFVHLPAFSFSSVQEPSKSYHEPSIATKKLFSSSTKNSAKKAFSSFVHLLAFFLFVCSRAIYNSS